MKASIDYENSIQDLQKDISAMLDTLEEGVEPCLKQIGSVVSVEVERTAPRSDSEYYWYKGEKRQNTHIADDVVYKVKKKTYKHGPYVSISGGKKTWPKWVLANDGHVAENGKFIPGNHFVEKSAKASEEKVDGLINRLIKGVIE